MASLKAVIPAIGMISAALNNFNPFPFNPGFDIEAVTQLAVALPTHSWEYGTTGEALIELYSPQFSVFGPSPFPIANLTRKKIRALDYVAGHMRLGDGSFDALDRGNGAAGDPASMGVFAVMLGKTEPTFASAAKRTAEGLLNDVPRGPTGAISHRASVAEFWADFMSMVPPFLAFYAADTDDADLLRESVRQCRLYRQILQQPNDDQPYKGAWRHIRGPQAQDNGLWSTGNAWAAAGMARVLVTVRKAPVASNASWQQGAITELTGYIKEILDGAMGSNHDRGLLRNYYDDVGGSHGFGEISGSALLAAVAYRMAVENPDVFGNRYIEWAERIRVVLAGQDRNGNPHITNNGVATPAVNPLGWLDPNPFTSGSPEGQAFVVQMYAAYRDCIHASRCDKPPVEGSGMGFSASGTSLPVVPVAGTTAGARRMIKRTHNARRRTLHGDRHTA